MSKERKILDPSNEDDRRPSVGVEPLKRIDVVLISLARLLGRAGGTSANSERCESSPGQEKGDHS
ncbi:hypothetical protein [Aliiruegeria sabulilitoris]|uniref:hypothetical protein n=1 Tax=Aliiruegeria sabulilitoris TaxID=1510458 RepID=UPI0012E358F8|nr:hypothetical protein [Aliiruegeria sabulilitoris]NDR55662.1 hypothetical protein [Pseudoruegeria sp. M32A2M]